MMPMFPLQSAPLPGDTVPLRIFEPRYARLVRDCVAAAEPVFGVVLISQGAEVGGGDIRSDVGVRVRITECVEDAPNQFQLIGVAQDRIRVIRWLPDDPYPVADTESWPDEPGPPVGVERIGEVVDRILTLYRRVADAAGGTLRPDVLAVDADIAEDPARHIYTLAARVPMGQADRYAVLAAPTLDARVDALLDAIETVTAMVEFQLSEE